MRTTSSVWSLGFGSLMALALLQSGCKGSAPGEGGAGSGSATAAGSATGSAGSAGPGAANAAEAAAAVVALPAPRLADADVRALLDQWLAAQNGGDFAAYQALYATKMEGVKRVAERTWRFDRKGWLADRQRMFGKPMKVAASSVTITSAGPTATVELEQSFAQGKFSDRGPKRLVVVKEAGGLRIAREELLRSEVVGAPRPAGRGGVYLVTTIEHQRYVYLALDEAQDATRADWGTGPLEGPLGGDPMLALRDAGKAPAAWASWKGREVAAYAADGTRCQARIESLSLVAGGTPHFGEVQMWNGDASMSDDGRVYTPAERAELVFAMSTPYLVGELEVEGSCAPVVVIEPAGGAAARAPVFYPPSEPDADGEKVALKAYRALPEYKALQREWKGEWSGKGEWASHPLVRVYTGADKRYVAVSTSIVSCGEFSGDLSVLFEERKGKLVPVPLDGAPELRPTALFDSDGDGAIEAVAPGSGFGNYETYLTVRDGALTPAAQVVYPFNDCGC